MVKKVKKNLSQKTLAKQLGLSISTISRALANDKRISRETIKRVKNLAKKLNYRPNLFAKYLKRGEQTFTIGVIIPEIVHYFFSSILNGIETVARKNGYHIIIMLSHDKEKTEKKCVKKLLNLNVDGILVSLAKSSQDFSHFQLAKESGIPLVFFDRITKEVKTNFVVIDDYQAAYKLTNHLIEMGSKRIIHLTSPPNLLITLNRKKGYLDALLKHRLVSSNRATDYIFNADSYSKSYRVIDSLCSSDILPFDGIFACNDLAAAGAIEALQKYNKKIPEDVVIGSFTYSFLAKALSITSVDQKGKKIGKLAMKTILGKINDSNNFEDFNTLLIKSKLIVRNSSLRNSYTYELKKLN